MKKNITRLLLLSFLFVTTQSVHSQQKLFTVIQDTIISIPPETDSAIGKSIRVKIDFNLLDTTGELKIMLPQNDSLVLVKKKKEPGTPGRFVWYGMIENQPGSFAILAVVNHIATGRIVTTGRKQYRLSYLKNNVHLLTEIDAAKLKTNRYELPPLVPQPHVANIEEGCPDSPLAIDIMVVYTQDALAESSEGNNDEDLIAMESFIDQLIALTNLSYERSNVNLHLKRVGVGTGKIIFPEMPDQDYDIILNTLQQDPAVHALRDLYKADAVVLLIEYWGYIPRLRLDGTIGHFPIKGNSFIRSEHSPEEDYGYSVVRRSLATFDFTFPHELGHQIGARHDRKNDPTDNSPFAFNHGYWNPGDGDVTEDHTWKTIMSLYQDDRGSYVRRLYWSNPDLKMPDFSPLILDMGTATENNAFALNLSAPIVSRFRCASPPVNNVWMRDTYNDTGQEPDPNTAGESMSRSPYIWIRNTQDISDPPGQFPMQQQHQNPVFNQDNWIYVKMHNGGPAITGQLEIYIAQASAGLTWPISWTLLKTINVTMSEASTKIIETEWKKEDMPGSGHYCMLGRWMSGADPVGPDISNVTDYTRQNNNVVWRNLNIVELGEAEETTAFMMVRNTTGGPLTLEFNDPAIFPKTAFTETGIIYIIPDSALYKAWRKGKSQYKGFSFENGKIRILNNKATLSNIKLPKKINAKLTIVFAKQKTTMNDRYLFTVTEWAGKHQKKKYIGEVGYEIYTYKRTDTTKK